MAEHKLFTGDTPHVSTFAFHEHRERAPHIEQDAHRPRLLTALGMITAAVRRVRADRADNPPQRDVTVADFGCGDGGLLSLIKDMPGVTGWGYDFAPANRAGWAERGVEAYPVDAFDPGLILTDMVGDIVVTTEVLEHLADPHQAVRRLRLAGATYLVASSPWTEHAGSHDECHAWAWDVGGYCALLAQGGWQILLHTQIGMFQVVLAEAATP